eukprot:547170_1
MRDRWRLESELDDNDDIDTDEKSENNNAILSYPIIHDNDNQITDVELAVAAAVDMPHLNDFIDSQLNKFKEELERKDDMDINVENGKKNSDNENEFEMNDNDNEVINNEMGAKNEVENSDNENIFLLTEMMPDVTYSWSDIDEPNTDTQMLELNQELSKRNGVTNKLCNIALTHNESKLIKGEETVIKDTNMQYELTEFDKLTNELIHKSNGGCKIHKLNCIYFINTTNDVTNCLLMICRQCNDTVISFIPNTHNIWQIYNKNDKWKSKYIQLEHKCNHMEENTLKIEQEHTLFMDKYKQTINKVISLQNNYKQSNQKLEKSNAKVKNLEHLLQKCKSKKEKTKQKYQKQTTQIQSLQLENTQMKEKCKDLEKSMANMEDFELKCDVFMKEANKKQSEYNKLEIKCKDFELKCNDIKNERNKLNNRLSKKENENNKLNAMCRNIEESLQKSINKQKKLKQEYEKDINQMQRKYNNVTAQQKLTKHKVNELQFAYDKLEKEYNEVENKFYYLSWNATEIANWILNINKKK